MNPRSILRRAPVAVAAAAAGALLLIPASSAGASATTATITTAAGQFLPAAAAVEQGQTIYLSASGFTPGSAVLVEPQQGYGPQTQSVADAKGAVSAAYTVPADAANGAVTVALVGSSVSDTTSTSSTSVTDSSATEGGISMAIQTPVVVAANFEVAASGVATATATFADLASTGTDDQHAVIIGSALLAVGGLLCLTARRRRPRTR